MPNLQPDEAPSASESASESATCSHFGSRAVLLRVKAPWAES